MSTPRFSLGQTVITPAAIDRLAARGVNPAELLTRHLVGDWGNLDSEDREANERALEHGDRMLSAYRLSPTESVWVIAESDRSVTTILCPEDY